MNLGIDLGSSNAIMSTIIDNRPEIIYNNIHQEFTPTVICVTNSDVLVGEEAVNMALIEPDRTQELNIGDIGTETTYEIAGSEYDPHDIAKHIFKRLVADAKEALNEEVQGATVVVPYTTSTEARHTIQDAAEQAGLTEIETISEPLAACLGYDMNPEGMNGKTILVYNLGEQYFDVSIVEIDENQLKIKAADGHPALGGKDITNKLYEYAKSQLEKQGVELKHIDEAEKEQLFKDVKQAKETLSVQEYVVTASWLEGNNYEIEITRDIFNELIDDIVNKTIEITEDLLNSKDIGAKRIDEVMLIGGSTRIPIVRERLEERFGTEPRTDGDPSRVIAKGAAIAADKDRTDEYII